MARGALVASQVRSHMTPSGQHGRRRQRCRPALQRQLALCCKIASLEFARDGDSTFEYALATHHALDGHLVQSHPCTICIPACLAGGQAERAPAGAKCVSTAFAATVPASSGSTAEPAVSGLSGNDIGIALNGPGHTQLRMLMDGAEGAWALQEVCRGLPNCGM